MRKRIAIAMTALATLFGHHRASAHHSFAAEFDGKNCKDFTGTLTKLDWQSPHAFFYMDIKNPAGKVVNWAIEAGGPNQLLRRGLRKTDFPAGIEVVIKGYRAKNGSNTANGRTVTLKDGRNFFMGSSGGPADGAER